MGCRRTCTPARHCQRHRNSTGTQRRRDPVGRPLVRRTRRSGAGLSLPGRGVSFLLRWEYAAAFCPLTPPTCTLPPGNVGATRWVAHWVGRVHWDRIGSCGADVHNGARATHRVAPTCRAYRRVRYTREHGTATRVSVARAVREPPLQRPAMLHRIPRWDRLAAWASPGCNAPTLTPHANGRGSYDPARRREAM
jgi:hypothetical protein